MNHEIDANANPFTLTFHDGDNNLIGKLSVRNGKMHFEGDVDESAKLFFECVCKVYDREVIALSDKLERMLN